MADMTPDEQLRLARLLWPEREWRSGERPWLAEEHGIYFLDLTSPEAIGRMVVLIARHSPYPSSRWTDCKQALQSGDMSALARLVLTVLEEQTDG